jgi:hypothetical protein
LTAADDPAAAIAARFAELGGSAGVLGNPVGSLQPASSGYYQAYENGRISWSAATGAWETLGAIQARYVAIGGADRFGFPIGPATGVSGGTVQVFTAGRIWWSSGTGAWETIGAIGARFVALGGPASAGFPTAAESGIAEGAGQPFARVRIWWSGRTGAWETFGAIGGRYLALGGPASQGFPTGTENAVTGGSGQQFTRLRIWWSPATGAWETFGAVGDRFVAMGGPAAAGFPTAAEQPLTGGVVQVFTKVRIWWSGSSGAWETFGAIGARYVALGGAEAFGFPLTGEQHGGSGGWQWFGRGSVWWSGGTGAWETTGDIARQFVEGGGAVYSFYGFPSGSAYAYLGGLRQDFRGGSLLSGVDAVLDATFTSVTTADVWATWRPGCPVAPSSLTLVRLNFWGFDAKVHRGEIIVRSDLAGRVASVFGAALADHFPIRKMWRVDYYGGDDPTAMAADNTSGFNCRQVTGGTGLSPHAYGIAVDVNTVENPYYAGKWWPTTEYVDRSNVRAGMLFGYNRMTIAFQDNGFQWGASYLDYQHFQFVG